jgi:DNA-binding CsgD family transcriptional regulator
MEWERPLDVLEAAYRLDGTDDDWMRQLVRAATRVFRRQKLGSVGSLVWGKIDGDGQTSIAAITSAHVETATYQVEGGSPSDTWFRAHSRLPVAMQERLYFSRAFADSASQLTGLGDRLAKDRLWAQTGWDTSIVKDAVGLVGHDGTLNVAAVIIPFGEEVVFSGGARRLGERVATHIGTAFRLRRGRRATLDAADAVLSPAGRIEHLAAGVRGDAVRLGFSRRRQARSRGTSTDAALEIWQGLHDGRWSLVDYIDTDRKAFVLAVRNEPARGVASTLTDRQRAAVALASLGYANKQIAYALGLTAAAVAMLLARARAVAGVRTRAELVRAFKRDLAAPAGVE